MIWGGIAATWRTKTHMCQGNATGLFYRDNAIEPIVVPYACRHGNAFIFQDNNAKPHRARVVQDHLQFRRITTLSWPAKSPDLSSVKHLLAISEGIRRRPHEPQDINKLADASHEDWRQIPHWVAYQEALLSRLPGGEWRPYWLSRFLRY